VAMPQYVAAQEVAAQEEHGLGPEFRFEILHAFGLRMFTRYLNLISPMSLWLSQMHDESLLMAAARCISSLHGKWRQACLLGALSLGE
jgi:hypothetical protein